MKAYADACEAFPNVRSPFIREPYIPAEPSKSSNLHKKVEIDFNDFVKPTTKVELDFTPEVSASPASTPSSQNCTTPPSVTSVTLPTPPFYPNQGMAVPLNQLPLVTQVCNAANALYHTYEHALNVKEKERHAAEVSASEVAYANVQAENGQLWVCGKYGTDKLFFPVSISENFHIIPASHVAEPYRLIRFGEMERICQMTDAEFNDDKMLMEKIISTTHLQPSINLPQSRICKLFRNYINQNATEVHLAHYSGWHQDEDSQWHFALCHGSTHMLELPKKPEDIPSPEILTERSKAASHLSAEKVMELFQCFSDVSLQLLLFIWFHVSFLYTPLYQLGYAMPLGLSILSSSEIVHCCVSTLFSWYADPPISMNTQKKQFLHMIHSRRDQPLLLDTRGATAGNEKIVLQALVNGTIPPEESNGKFAPLGALPTLLCGKASALSRDPSFLTVELSTAALDPEYKSNVLLLSEYWSDYFRGFASYTSSNLSSLKALLEEESLTDLGFSFDEDCEITPESCKAIHILQAVQKFVHGYLESLSPSQELAQKMDALFTDNKSFLVSLVQRSVSTGSDDCARFLLVAGELLDEGKIKKIDCSEPISSEYLTDDAPAAAYSKNQFYCFNNDAFKLILARCGFSPRAMKQALREANLLEGIQKTGPYKVQLVVKDHVRNNKRLLVYKMRKKHFEDPSDCNNLFEDE